MVLSLVVAIDKDRLIGRDNKMPWHIPADLKRFKKITIGKAIVMGRKTFFSIGKPLSNRINIILTKNNQFSFPGTYLANSLEEAVNTAQLTGCSEVVFIGGGEVYAQVINLVDKMYITKIDHSFGGDGVRFPEIKENQWDLISREPISEKDDIPYKMEFLTFERRKK